TARAPTRSAPPRRSERRSCHRLARPRGPSQEVHGRVTGTAPPIGMVAPQFDPRRGRTSSARPSASREVRNPLRVPNRKGASGMSTGIALEPEQGRPAAASSRLDAKMGSSRPGRIGMVVFLVALIVGLGYAGYQLVADLGPVQLGSALPYVLLTVALLVALGFEFVNGFHDTANAVATVIYT